MRQLHRIEFLGKIQPWVLFRGLDNVVFNDLIFDNLIDPKYPQMRQLRIYYF